MGNALKSFNCPKCHAVTNILNGPEKCPLCEPEFVRNANGGLIKQYSCIERMKCGCKVYMREYANREEVVKTELCDMHRKKG